MCVCLVDIFGVVMHYTRVKEIDAVAERIIKARFRMQVITKCLLDIV